MSKPPHALDQTSLSLADTVNFAIQRTDLILDWPLVGRKGSFLFWQVLGWRGPLTAEVALRRQAILRRGADDIYAEFQAIKDRLPGAPRRVCDIGCGLGHFDIYLAQAFPVDAVLLLDIETTSHHRHSFNAEGSGYNSLPVARRFISANVPARTKVVACNPQREDWRPYAQEKFDFVLSLLSCGHHYPTDEYLELFRDYIEPGGLLLLDMRRDVDQNDLSDWFDVIAIVREDTRSRRTLFRKRDA